MAYFFDNKTSIQGGGEVNPTDTKEVSGQTVYDAMLSKIYPIGSVYLSVNNVSPQTFLGGTWVAIGQGKALFGVNPSDTDFQTSELSGGSKTKTLAVENLPSHGHTATSTFTGEAVNTGNMSANATHTHTISGNKQNSSYGTTMSIRGTGTGNTVTSDSASVEHTHSVTAQGSVSTTISNTGSGTAFSILDPYYTVYMWKRTA